MAAKPVFLFVLLSYCNLTLAICASLQMLLWGGARTRPRVTPKKAVGQKRKWHVNVFVVQWDHVRDRGCLWFMLWQSISLSNNKMAFFGRRASARLLLGKQPSPRLGKDIACRECSYCEDCGHSDTDMLYMGGKTQPLPFIWMEDVRWHSREGKRGNWRGIVQNDVHQKNSVWLYFLSAAHCHSGYAGPSHTCKRRFLVDYIT